MSWPAFLLALALALPGMAPAATLYKCATADGAVTFQQAPCAEGNGTRLEADEAFGVRPPSPRRRVAVSADDAATPDDDTQGPAVVDRTPSGQPIYAGPRGGRYTLTASGRKNYLPRPAGDSRAASTTPTPPADAPPEVHIDPRGGCYTVGRTGRKNYLPAERCPRD